MTGRINSRRTLVAGFVAILIFLAGCANQTSEITPTPEPTRDPKAEQPIVQQLQKINSAAVPVYQEATIAMDKGELEKSKKLYEQVTVIAPGFSTAYRRLSYIELDLHNLPQAEEFARKALALEAISYNQSLLAWILL